MTFPDQYFRNDWSFRVCRDSLRVGLIIISKVQGRGILVPPFLLAYIFHLLQNTAHTQRVWGYSFAIWILLFEKRVFFFIRTLLRFFFFKKSDRYYSLSYIFLLHVFQDCVKTHRKLYSPIFFSHFPLYKQKVRILGCQHLITCNCISFCQLPIVISCKQGGESQDQFIANIPMLLCFLCTWHMFAWFQLTKKPTPATRIKLTWVSISKFWVSFCVFNFVFHNKNNLLLKTWLRLLP